MWFFSLTHNLMCQAQADVQTGYGEPGELYFIFSLYEFISAFINLSEFHKLFDILVIERTVLPVMLANEVLYEKKTN